MGRPTDFNLALAHSICERLVAGTSLREILKDPGMPSRMSVFRWITKHADFQKMYTVAMELHCDSLCDKALALANGATPETANKVRLQIDVIRWRNSRLFPKRYSDRVQIAGDAEQPLLGNAVTLPMTPNEVSEGISTLLSQAEADVGITTFEGATDGERLRAILATGQPIPPSLYGAVMKWRKAKGDDATHH